MGDADALEQRFAADVGLSPVEPLVAHQNFGELLAERQGRVERGARVLEHHADAGAAHPVDFGRALGPQILAREPDCTAALDGVSRKVAHDREGERGLARAGFSDEPQNLAARDREANVVEGPEGAGRCRIIQGVTLHGEHIHAHALGFSASRRPSPSRLKPMATSAMARPGQTIIQGLRNR
jgi:hypothetical protein